LSKVCFFAGFQNWSSNLANIGDLKDTAISYLVAIGVIPESNQGFYEISECKLILNRLVRHIDTEKPYLKICKYYLIV
jgi:hypothetical protein